MKKNNLLLAAIALSSSSLTFAGVHQDHQGMNHEMMDHSSMSHDMMMTQGEHQGYSMMPTEAGNDAFGTIQEIMSILRNDPNTDWSKVNLEALRQHLLDMQDMTFNVDVLSQKPISNGMMVEVKPTTERAKQSLARVFKAHPAIFSKETGWDMQVSEKKGVYTLTTTSYKSEDVDKIRGLGYIGWMAYGDHHQPHHLAMARGDNPHAGQHNH